MEVTVTEEYKFRPGDEVCRIFMGNLIFGTVERQGAATEKSYSKNVPPPTQPSKVYTAHWNTSIYSFPKLPGIPNVVKESDIFLTDRTLIKGMKVRKIEEGDNGSIGTVSDVIIRGTFRILGTGTVIKEMDISSFRHLKQFKQKSVVYKEGWLGVVMDVSRLASVRYANGNEDKVNLSTIYSNGPLSLESSWISETRVDMSVPNPIIDFNNATFIKDLEVEGLTVRWVYNVDLNFPDPPPREVKQDKIKSLKLITESSTIDDTYHLGNLGRFTNNSCSFVCIKEFSTKFINENGIHELSCDSVNNNSLSGETKYNGRCYLTDRESEDLVLGGGDTGSFVVEIIHLSTIANIFWQAGSPELVRSTSLQILSKNLSLNVRSIGDYVYSEKFNYDPKLCFGVIQKMDLTNKTLTVGVFSCDGSSSIIRNKYLTLSESDVIPHPRYKFFNDGNAIVTNNEDDNLKIGHVQGNNLVGKLRVRWLDSTREEWCSPTTCSLYLLRGFDLDCIISMTNDDDEIVQETQDIKLQKTLMGLESVYATCLNVQEGVKLNIKELVDTIRRLYLVCLNVEEHYSDERGKHFPESKKSMDSDMVFGEACNDTIRFAQTYLTICETLIKETKEFIAYVKEQNQNKKLDVPTQIQYSEIFNEPLDFGDQAPKDHKFESRKAEHANLVQVVKLEYRTIRETKAPGIKVRAFGNRLDLFSAGISGPTETIYENSLYLFDGYLPPTYPHVPPEVLFLPFKSGRLNPNLYDCGKVCLSLLGTWTGSSTERWTKESNLHQVLLSVQALILVKEPYHNEPGFANTEKCNKDCTISARHKYNTNLAPIVCAMINGQLKYPPAIWKEDIQKFYLENLPVFISRWKNWIEVGKKYSVVEKIKEVLNENFPGFTIFPMSPEFITRMTAQIDKLEQMLAILKRNVQEEQPKPDPDPESDPMEID